jgi:DNA ligase-1
MMLLAQLVETSDRIAKTSKRLEKIELLSSLLRQLEPNEAEICVAYLSGRARQGRIGVGYATLASARQEPASQGRMTLKQVDDSLSEIEATSGKGSTQLRAERLRALFAQATTAEQDFLFRLLIGELRQGALEGIMVEALAKASGAPIDKVRRAAMMAGDSMAIAPRLLTEGESALHAYDVQLFRPVQPMLAQTAEDLDEAFEELDNPALEYKMDGARVQIHRSGDQVRDD